MAWTHDLDPIAFTLGEWPVRWYGLMYLAGYLQAVALSLLYRSGARLGVSAVAFLDLLFFAMLGVIFGARIGYMLFYDLAAWLDTIDATTVGPLLSGLRKVIASFVDIGLGYLSLDRSSGTLSGGEAQRTKMIRHLGSSLTDVTYVFDEPTIGLHPHDIERMNQLLL